MNNTEKTTLANIKKDLIHREKLAIHIAGIITFISGIIVWIKMKESITQ